MIILVDMDGVLADFDTHFFNLTQEFSWPEGYTPVDQQHRFASDHLPKSQKWEAQKVAHQQGFFRDLPPIEGAVEGLQSLAELATVWIVSKPLQANPFCRDEKAQWLDHHIGPRWSDRLILAPDKSLIRGNILLDDAPKLEWIDAASWEPIVYPHNWNTHPDSKWAEFPKWSWSDPIEDLVYY